MAKITQRPRVVLEVQFTIDEEEARALDALVGYGDDAFIAAFKESLGRAYLDGHEDGLRRFFASVREWLPQYLLRANAAREMFDKPLGQK
jgi:hypothetical protein